MRWIASNFHEGRGALVGFYARETLVYVSFRAHDGIGRDFKSWRYGLYRYSPRLEGTGWLACPKYHCNGLLHI